MLYYFKRAVSDIWSNKVLNIITIITIALCIVVVGSFALFFENISRILQFQEKGVEIMAYLDPEFTQNMLPGLKIKIKAMGKAEKIIFIPKDAALKQLKKEMASRSSFLNSLNGNPLPDAIKIVVKQSINKWSSIAAFAAKLKRITIIEDVEYGEKWLGRFLSVLKLFKISGYAIGSLFFMISIFVTANTIRLAFYSRNQEIEIMRLVGATDNFIITPFYIEGFLQGIAGGITGLGILFMFFKLLSLGVERNVPLSMLFNIKFLSIKYSVIIISCSTFSGWLGSYLSLKKILKY